MLPPPPSFLLSHSVGMITPAPCLLPPPPGPHSNSFLGGRRSERAHLFAARCPSPPPSPPCIIFAAALPSWTGRGGEFRSGAQSPSPFFGARGGHRGDPGHATGRFEGGEDRGVPPGREGECLFAPALPSVETKHRSPWTRPPFIHLPSVRPSASLRCAHAPVSQTEVDLHDQLPMSCIARCARSPKPN